MNVSDLIAELQRLPQHLPVKVLLDSVTTISAEHGYDDQTLTEADALPADQVLRCGGYVLIKGT